MNRKSVLRLAGAVVLIVFLIVAAWKLPLRHWAESFILWVRSGGLPGAFVFGVVYALAAILMIPGIVLTAGAGLVYGTVIGVLIVSPASVLGATGAFLVARYFARDWVERKLQKYPKSSAMNRAVAKQGFRIVLLLRLQPILPFVLLNYALGLTRVRLRDYVLASWIGMLPATVVYVYFGSALHSVSDLFSGGLAKHSVAGMTLFWGGLAAGVLLMWFLTRLANTILQRELGQGNAA